ncbi:hypothetical protein PIB30_007207 [Stylosanthes scabra]|uniref:Uncharacterized protein n=1 Tax=Stylosanthes scabra TaxID=79078 RepID=A0ABU6V6Z2_9FABA|nr:hypothetical protein [Stylosanthes scabra]
MKESSLSSSLCQGTHVLSPRPHSFTQGFECSVFRKLTEASSPASSNSKPLMGRELGQRKIRRKRVKTKRCVSLSDDLVSIGFIRRKVQNKSNRRTAPLHSQTCLPLSPYTLRNPKRSPPPNHHLPPPTSQTTHPPTSERRRLGERRRHREKEEGNHVVALGTTTERSKKPLLPPPRPPSSPPSVAGEKACKTISDCCRIFCASLIEKQAVSSESVVDPNCGLYFEQFGGRVVCDGCPGSESSIVDVS